ncbi:MAG: hypothetical protein WC915_05375 [archaeon]|jgi:predicted DNA-binding transcriptional regulator
MERLIKKITKKINDIRDRKFFLKRNVGERMNESHARELVARTIVMPQLKKFFGKDLLSVLIVGSSQLGVRYATRKVKSSDIDINFVVKTLFWEKMTAEQRLNVKQEITRIENLVSQTGIKASILLSIGKDFAFERTAPHMFGKNPFQVLYGKDWVDKQLKDYVPKNLENRRNYSKPY